MNLKQASCLYSGSGGGNSIRVWTDEDPQPLERHCPRTAVNSTRALAGSHQPCYSSDQPTEETINQRRLLVLRSRTAARAGLMKGRSN